MATYPNGGVSPQIPTTTTTTTVGHPLAFTGSHSNHDALVGGSFILAGCALLVFAAKCPTPRFLRRRP